MNVKSQNTPTAWVDPDDAPELTDKFFAKATPMIGGLVVAFEEFAAAAEETVRRGRPKAVFTKERISIRLSPEVVGRFRTTGPGWQTRMNAALKDWLKDHAPEEAA